MPSPRTRIPGSLTSVVFAISMDLLATCCASTDLDLSKATVGIHGADSRGALFGVGQFLRSLHWTRYSASISAGLDIATSPTQPIRGHQLGYRNTANSYDGWDEKQFEQYIRELALFGANSI